MRYFIQYLQLIKVVHDNYNHIQQMETLSRMFDNLQPSVWLKEEEIKLLSIVIETTINSHYDYHYLLAETYTNPENHIDVIYKNKYIAEYGQERYDEESLLTPRWHNS